MNQYINRREGFNSNALTYRDIRPSYPSELFETLVDHVRLSDNAHLLEIGPGTGQATLPLAKRGYQITAVELGNELANVAREELKEFSNVTIVTGAFEDLELADASLDLIYSATAFHWIKPEVQFTKTHRLLKPDGHLAIIHTNHISDGAGDAYFFASQPIYKKYDPTDDQNFRLPQLADLRPCNLDTSLFGLSLFKTFPVVIKYTAEEYGQLLSTYSPTLAMPEATRDHFLNEIVLLIKSQFNGALDKHFAMSLTIAARK